MPAVPAAHGRVRPEVVRGHLVLRAASLPAAYLLHLHVSGCISTTFTSQALCCCSSAGAACARRFGSQDCAEECPQPWGALAAAAAVPAWHDNGTAGAYPHLGAGCQQQMLCMVCGRKECDGCTYSW